MQKLSVKFIFILVVSVSLFIIPSCKKPIEGCMDSNACNYCDEATEDDGSCVYPEIDYDCTGNYIGIDTVEVLEHYDEGLFVTCEGNFMAANGSLSFIAEDGSVENGVFEAVNGFPLGDVVQSMSIIDTLAYIVVNNSGKVIVADAGTMEFVANVEGVGSPRYITQAGEGQAYITDSNGQLHVLDLNTNEITESIAVGFAPEQVITVENYAFVVNAGWGSGNTVSVIDVTSNQVVETITVADNPTNLAVDGSFVWVLSGGNTIWNSDWTAIEGHTAGALTAINPTTFAIEKTFDFVEGEHPSGLTAYAGELYFKNGASIYKQSVDAAELDASELVSGSYYGQITIYKDHLYAADAVDFSQSGWVYQYTTNGELVDSSQVGLIPGNFAF